MGNALTKVKVAIYEDNLELLDTLTKVIESSERLQLAGAYPDCMNAIENTKNSLPDVIIMDIDMPGKSGIQAVREIKEIHPEIEIIMHTVFDEDEKVFGAILNGATGYLLKDTPMTILERVILDVNEGGAPMSSKIARKLMTSYSKSNKKSGIRKELNLSEREEEVIQFLAKGLSYKMIANEMNLSINTIRSYIKRIYEKLHVNSATEALNKIFLNSTEGE